MHPVPGEAISESPQDTERRDSPLRASRPTDDEIIAHENSIRMAEAAKIRYIGDLEGLGSLQREYERGSQIFVAKIDHLSERYDKIRRTRGDGNCFFRGFCFAYLEYLVSSRNSAERERMRAALSDWGSKLEEGGFERIVFEDALELLQEMVDGSADGTVEAVLERMRDEGTSQMLVMLLRFIAAREIQRRADFFAPFILGMSDDYVTVDQFCNKSVMVMGEESDHIHIVALSDALSVPLSVIYLDGNPMGAFAAGDATGGGVTVAQHDFVPEGCTAGPLFSLLYRPGHYDILYRK